MSNYFEPRAALVTQIRLLLRVSCQSNASSESARRGKFESLLYLNVFTDAVHTAYWLQALDCSFWSAEQPLPEPQQAGQSPGMNRDCSLLDRIQPPRQEGFNVILPVLWQAECGDRWQEEASTAQSKSTRSKASVRPCRCSQSPEKVREVPCTLKAQLRMVCIGDLVVLHHFCNFSNALNLWEVKPHPLLLHSQLPTFSYTPGMNPLFLIFAV